MINIDNWRIIHLSNKESNESNQNKKMEYALKILKGFDRVAIENSLTAARYNALRRYLDSSIQNKIDCIDITNEASKKIIIARELMDNCGRFLSEDQRIFLNAVIEENQFVINYDVIKKLGNIVSLYNKGYVSEDTIENYIDSMHTDKYQEIKNRSTKQSKVKLELLEMFLNFLNSKIQGTKVIDYIREGNDIISLNTDFNFSKNDLIEYMDLKEISKGRDKIYEIRIPYNSKNYEDKFIIMRFRKILFDPKILKPIEIKTGLKINLGNDPEEICAQLHKMDYKIEYVPSNLTIEHLVNLEEALRLSSKKILDELVEDDRDISSIYERTKNLTTLKKGMANNPKNGFDRIYQLPPTLICIISAMLPFLFYYSGFSEWYINQLGWSTLFNFLMVFLYTYIISWSLVLLFIKKTQNILKEEIYMFSKQIPEILSIHLMTIIVVSLGLGLITSLFMDAISISEKINVTILLLSLLYLANMGRGIEEFWDYTSLKIIVMYLILFPLLMITIPTIVEFYLGSTIALGFLYLIVIGVLTHRQRGANRSYVLDEKLKFFNDIYEESYKVAEKFINTFKDVYPVPDNKDYPLKSRSTLKKEDLKGILNNKFSYVINENFDFGYDLTKNITINVSFEIKDDNEHNRLSFAKRLKEMYIKLNPLVSDEDSDDSGYEYKEDVTIDILDENEVFQNFERPEEHSYRLIDLKEKNKLEKYIHDCINNNKIVKVDHPKMYELFEEEEIEDIIKNLDENEKGSFDYDKMKKWVDNFINGSCDTGFLDEVNQHSELDLHGNPLDEDNFGFFINYNYITKEIDKIWDSKILDIYGEICRMIEDNNDLQELLNSDGLYKLLEEKLKLKKATAKNGSIEIIEIYKSITNNFKNNYVLKFVVYIFIYALLKDRKTVKPANGDKGFMDDGIKKVFPFNIKKECVDRNLLYSYDGQSKDEDTGD